MQREGTESTIAIFFAMVEAVSHVCTVCILQRNGNSIYKMKNQLNEITAGRNNKDRRTLMMQVHQQHAERSLDIEIPFGNIIMNQTTSSSFLSKHHENIQQMYNFHKWKLGTLIPPSQRIDDGDDELFHSFFLNNTFRSNIVENYNGT